MSLRFLLKVLRFLAILAILVGCAFQSWGVTREHFEYRTSSAIAIREDPGEIVKAPAVVLCVRFDKVSLVETRIGRLFSGNHDYLHDRNDTWGLIKLWSQVFPPGKRFDHTTTKFLKGNKYCLFLKVQEQFSMAEVTGPLILSLPVFFRANFTVDPLHSNYTYRVFDRRCNPKPIYFQVMEDWHSVYYSRNRYVVRFMCTRLIKSYLLYLSYAVSVNVKLPPPYDTNCLDYRGNGPYLSSHHCFDECLKRETEELNIVPGLTVIERKRYLTSNADIAPARIMEDEMALTNLLKVKSSPEKLLQTYEVLRSRWRVIKKSCRESCAKPDCRMERYTPRVTYFEAGPEIGNDTFLAFFDAGLRTSDQPMLIVTTIPKQGLVDYLVYMCSGLSFWLGFCPLALADKGYARLQHWLKVRRERGRRKSRRSVRGVLHV